MLYLYEAVQQILVIWEFWPASGSEVWGSSINCRIGSLVQNHCGRQSLVQPIHEKG